MTFHIFWKIGHVPNHQPVMECGVPGLVNILKKLLNNCPVEIVDLPINSMVMFHSFLYVYQRVTGVTSQLMG
jgi:hypothetical protein